MMTKTDRYSHRFNDDGTVDSICHDCFATVATERAESALTEGERRHSCNPLVIEWYHKPTYSLTKAHWSDLSH